MVNSTALIITTGALCVLAVVIITALDSEEKTIFSKIVAPVLCGVVFGLVFSVMAMGV